MSYVILKVGAVTKAICNLVVRSALAASLSGCLWDLNNQPLDAGTDVPPPPPPPLLVAQTAYVKASINLSGGRFGQRVALSSDGTTLAVSSPGDGGGVVDVYVRAVGTGWQHERRLVPMATSAEFGSALALSADGDVLVVGAQYDPVGCSCPGSFGAAYAFTRTGGVWSTPQQVLPSRQGDGFFFGNALALSADGNTLAVGAVGTGPQSAQTFTGAVYVFSRAGGSWTETKYLPGAADSDNFGQSVALTADGSMMFVAAGNYIGAVRVFIRTVNDWVPGPQLVGNDVAPGDFFAADVAVSSDGAVIAVGAIQPPAPIPAMGAGGNGAVYVFERDAAGWSQRTKLVASNGDLLDYFGTRVALDGSGTRLFASASSEDGDATGVDGNQASSSAPESGAVYSFQRDGSGWTQSNYIKASNTDEADLFGYGGLAVSRDGSTLVVGAIGEDSISTGLGGDQADESSSNAGAAYVFSVD